MRSIGRPLAFLRQNSPPTRSRTTTTRIPPLRRRRMPFLQLVRVVVRQLLSRRYVADRFDPDSPIVNHRVAVRIAGVIDEPRVVPVDRRVDHDVIVDREQERVMAGAVFRIARVGDGWRQSLARVLDQPCAGGNAPGGERAKSLDRGRPDLERIPAQECFSTAVTPPEMMYAITSGASASMRVTREAGTTMIWPANPYDCGM